MTFQAKRVIPSWTCSTLSNSKMWWVKHFQNLASHGSWCNQLVILVQKAIDAGNFISKTPVFSDVLWDVYFFSGHLFWVMLLRFCSSGSSDACFLNWSYYSVVNASYLLRFQVPSLLSFLVRKLCYVCVPKTLFFLPWK